jgi:hypothetical protein
MDLAGERAGAARSGSSTPDCRIGDNEARGTIASRSVGASVGDGKPLKNLEGCVIGLSEHAPKSARRLVHAVLATAIRGPRQAGQRRDGPIDQAQHLAERDRGRILEKEMATIPSAPASDQPRTLEFQQDMLEETLRNLLARRDVARLEFLRVAARQRNERFECVSSFLGDH